LQFVLDARLWKRIWKRQGGDSLRALRQLRQRTNGL